MMSLGRTTTPIGIGYARPDGDRVARQAITGANARASSTYLIGSVKHGDGDGGEVSDWRARH